MIVIRIPAKPKEEKAQKLRVAAYCRVSSTDTEQIASLELQVYYYERKIKSNKSWLYRGVYYEDTHPAIVSKELFEKVQLQLKSK